MPNFEYFEVSKVIADNLGYEFSSPELLTMALTHTSYINENPSEKHDNQRLEFLGDAILGLVVAEMLMEQLPVADEGQLTPRRSALVKEKTLVKLARRIDLGSFLRLGHGEELNNGRDRSSILADAVEALIGAIHIDGGYEASKAATLRWFGSMLDEVALGTRPDDVKSTLQEALQALNKEVPTYRVVQEEGPDHAKVFEVEISVAGEVLAIGRGKSKKVAEKDAAKRALATMEER